MTTKSDLIRPIGVTGLSLWRGIIGEEYLPALKGAKAYKIFREMEDDIVIGALMDAMKRPLLAAEFGVNPASEKGPDQKAAEFVEQNMYDMNQYSWRQHVLDCLDILTFGWAISEAVFKKRNGMEHEPSSMYDDGRLGLQSLEPRAEETLDHWGTDDDGNFTSMVQRDPNSGLLYEIPLWKSVHCTFRSRKRNPEGRSPFRSLYKVWYMRKNLEVFEAIGIERDLAGLPVIKLPYGASGSDADFAEKIVRRLRQDEEAGVVLPAPRTPDAQAQRWELNLLSGGSKMYNTRETIRDYNKLLLMRFFAQFLLLGMEQVGTQALVKGSHDFFSLALKSIQQELCEAWNQQLVPLLFEFNKFPGMTAYPEITWSEPGKADTRALADTVGSLVASGIVRVDGELEKFLRAMAGLPEMSEELEKQPRAMPVPATFEKESTPSAVSFARTTPARRLTEGYRRQLLLIYDSWVKRVSKLIRRAEEEKRDISLVVNANIGQLADDLKLAGRKSIRDAVILGLKQEPDADALVLIADRIRENEKFIDESLVPDVREKIAQGAVGLLDVVEYEYDPNQPRDDRGRWGEGGGGGGGGAVSEGSHERANRAVATHKPCTRAVRREASKSEKLTSSAVGGERTGDNEPFDVISGKNCIEVKTIVRGTNDKVTMHPESLARKQAYLKEHGAIGHTVVFDKRNDKIYYKNGLGSFRLSNMQTVGSVGELAGKLGGR